MRNQIGAFDECPLTARRIALESLHSNEMDSMLRWTADVRPLAGVRSLVDIEIGALHERFRTARRIAFKRPLASVMSQVHSNISRRREYFAALRVWTREGSVRWSRRR